MSNWIIRDDAIAKPMNMNKPAIANSWQYLFIIFEFIIVDTFDNMIFRVNDVDDIDDDDDDVDDNEYNEHCFDVWWRKVITIGNAKNANVNLVNRPKEQMIPIRILLM